MIKTKRLILRNWQASDRQHFAEMNADTEVMQFFPKMLTKEESNAQIGRMQAKHEQNGWGAWAVVVKKTGEFIGMVGLNEVEIDNAIPETPFVEIAWRLRKAHWGKGYAFEAATACLDYAFNTLRLENIYAFTALINEPSRRLMEKLGMHNTHQDFNHPKVAKGHILERHCLYKIERKTYLEKE
ncbi:MAG: GNAT family N-acetyltransferase [Gammaproteobacteria bacterium]|nr:MAG: GNAT family N-acetyltransferase [Gammaproteobacteria bacterium]